MNEEREPMPARTVDGAPAVAPYADRAARRARRIGRWAVLAVFLAIISVWGRLFFFDAAPLDDRDLIPAIIPMAGPDQNGPHVLAEAWGTSDGFDRAAPPRALPFREALEWPARTVVGDHPPEIRWVGDLDSRPRRLAALPWERDSRRTPCEELAQVRWAHSIVAARREALESLEVALECPVWAFPTAGRMETPQFNFPRDLQVEFGSLLALRLDLAIREQRAGEAFADALRLLHLGVRWQQAEAVVTTYALLADDAEIAGLSCVLIVAERVAASDAELAAATSRLDELARGRASLELAIRHSYRRSIARFPRERSSLQWKVNRTRRALYERCHAILDRQRFPLCERPPLPEEWITPSIVGSFVTGNSWGRVCGVLGAEELRHAEHAHANRDFLFRAVSLALALLRYRLREGSLPPTLDALVPDFLPALPADPFTGGPIRYDPVRAILWSPGSDGIDRGGIVGDLLEPDPAEPTVRVPAP